MNADEYQDWATEDSAIVGGVTTDIAQVPWQVSLQTQAGDHFCGGTIVAPRWIVTAAHCVEQGAPAKIVAGASLLSQPNQGQTVAVTRAISAPGYTDPTAGKDVAMLELATPLALNGTTVRAIRPVTPSDARAGIDATGINATVSGWGTLVSGGNISNSLQSVVVPIVSLTDARADYGINLSDDQLPAGVRGIGGKDSCQGDSGGPLVVTHAITGETKLAGVVSWGNGCADPNYPGLYARASSFFQFIDSHAGGLPTASAGADQTVAVGRTAVLDGSASVDVSVGSIVSYSWVQTLGTPVQLTAAGAGAQIVAPNSPETLEFELTVTDDSGNTASDRVAVTVEQAQTTPPPSSGGDQPADAPGIAQPDGQAPTDIVGGCSAGGGAGSPLLLSLLSCGLLLGRRRRDAR